MSYTSRDCRAFGIKICRIATTAFMIAATTPTLKLYISISGRNMVQKGQGIRVLIEPSDQDTSIGKGIFISVSGSDQGLMFFLAVDGTPCQHET
jgi:hypothetical protein